jgi:hypothetical protein
MDVARCTLDNVTYKQVRFATLPPGELSRKRRFLVCPECGGPSFFRKASCSGQAACFGARPHNESCSLATSEYERNDLGLGDDQDILSNPSQHIVIDFDFGAQQTERHNDPNAVANVGGRGGRFVGDGARRNAAMHRRLSSILRNLSTSAQFRASRQIVEIEGIGEFPVADFFVHFQAVASMQEGRYRGYWGMIAYARSGQGGELWLNSRGLDDMSICVPEEFVDEFYRRFRISDEEDLAGADALIFGTLRNSQNGKQYIQVEDLGFITIHLT